MIPIINVLIDEVIVPLIDAFSRAIVKPKFWIGVLIIFAILIVCWLISGQTFGEYFSWDNVKRLFGLMDVIESLQDKLFGGGDADSAESTSQAVQPAPAQ